MVYIWVTPLPLYDQVLLVTILKMTYTYVVLPVVIVIVFMDGSFAHNVALSATERNIQLLTGEMQQLPQFQWGNSEEYGLDVLVLKRDKLLPM